MIHRHDFNSDWWGGDVGVVTDLAFFDRNPAAVQSDLNAFEWVEFATGPDASPAVGARLAAAGFAFSDFQLDGKLRLGRLPAMDGSSDLTVTSAAEHDFDLSTIDTSQFVRERFFALPGVEPELVTRRYTGWAETLAQEHPDLALIVLHRDKPQGWFVSNPESGALRLNLAAATADATVSGLLVYHAALTRYAAAGHRVGLARFSTTNTPVLNIYSSMGLRFTGWRCLWLWQRA